MEAFPGHMNMQTPAYTDTILTITNSSCPDPYVVLHNGTYYLTFTSGGHIEIWSADSLFDFEQKSTKKVIWRPPSNTAYSADIWAPEIHMLEGRWYIYFAAADAAVGNKSHRMYVLRGPTSTTRLLNPSDWDFHGPLHGLPPDQWAIDGTILTLRSTPYIVYSGWPPGTTHNATRQELFIAEMASPTTVCTAAAPTRISTPDLPFEFSGLSGINEGPQFLASPDGTWAGIVYSCAGSWTSEYKMNILYYTGGHPLLQTSWCKSNTPLIRSSRDDSPPYAPGHGSFVMLHVAPSVPEVWCVFHATDEKTGWEGRKARVMRVGWGMEGRIWVRGSVGGVVVSWSILSRGVRGECGVSSGQANRVFLEIGEDGKHGDFKAEGMGNVTRVVGKVGKAVGKVGTGIMSKFSSK